MHMYRWLCHVGEKKVNICHPLSTDVFGFFDEVDTWPVYMFVYCAFALHFVQCKCVCLITGDIVHSSCTVCKEKLQQPWPT